MHYRLSALLLLLASLTACTTSNIETSATRSATTAHIDAARVADIVKVLASDEFEGRAPGTPGEDKTVAYLVDRFAALGLEPGGENGGWTQSVPLIHTQVQEPSSVSLMVGNQVQALEQVQDIEISTVRPVPRIDINKVPVVFVGFGVGV